MKKICLATVLILGLLLAPAVALAAGATAQTTPTPTPTPTSTVTPTPTPTPIASQAPQETPEPADVGFTVDNQNVYEGMDKAYQQGYTPTVRNGKAVVILPLIASGEMRGNSLTAVPNLGATGGSPFAFRNIQATVKKKDCAVNDAKKVVSAYLIRFDLPLVSGRVNGVYPVQIDVQAKSAGGTAIQQSFTTYVTIRDGKDPNKVEAPPSTPKPDSQPKVLVESYKVQPTPIEAGAEFTATVTLRNTNEKRAVQNMTVMVSADSPNLTLLNESSSFFIQKLGKSETVDLELKFRSDLNTPPQRYTVTLSMDYDNDEAVALASAGAFPVEIGQPLRVEMAAPELVSTVNAGDTFAMALQVMNLGRGAVYNVRCELNVPGLVPSGAAFIGNMEAGSAASQKIDVFVGTRDMGPDKNVGKYGLTQGVVKLLYEDGDGKEYAQEFPVSTTIQELVITKTEEPEEEKPKLTGQWWISALIAAGVVAALVIALLARRRRSAA